MILKRKDKIGPHVIKPTSEKTTLYHNEKRVGRYREWRCKYCGVQDIHPKHKTVTIKWETDCDEIEWRETDTQELEQLKRES